MTQKIGITMHKLALAKGFFREMSPNSHSTSPTLQEEVKGKLRADME